MNAGLYSGVSAMQASERRLEAITANLANVDTPAYKRQTAVSHAFQVGSGEQAHLEVGTEYATDHSQGRLERTGEPLDFALLGDGFFAVDGPDGEVYTRNGSFRIDDTGVLQTTDGFPVVWRSGAGRIDSVGETVTVDTSGTVFQGDVEVGRLQVVDIPAVDQLELDRDGYFHASPALLRQPSDADVHQYTLERSNASSIDELIAMISVQRAFESATNLVHMLDESYRRLNRPR